MSERVVVYLNQNLDELELDGLPAWVDGSRYELGTSAMPSAARFVPGQDALVYSQRNNNRFLYVGILRGVYLDREGKAFTFDRFERLARPVLIEEGEDNQARTVYSEGKGFMNPFAYIPEAAFEEVIRRSKRSAPR